MNNRNKTNNTITKGKRTKYNDQQNQDKQCNNQKKKDKQYNNQEKKMTT